MNLDQILDLLPDLLSGNSESAAQTRSTPWIVISFWCLAIFVLYLVIARWIRRNDNLSADTRFRWVFRVRLIGLFLMVIGGVCLWTQETATATGLLIGILLLVGLLGRDLATSATGGLIQLTGGKIRVGDRIRVGEHLGDVIGISLLRTSILEVNESLRTTGRTITFANSIFLREPLTNESATEQFVLDEFSIAHGEINSRVEKEMTAELEQICAPYLQEAKKHFRKWNGMDGISVTSLDPKAIATLNDEGQLVLLIRLPVPVSKRGRVRYIVARKFLGMGNSGDLEDT